MRRTQPFLILSVVAAILFTAAFACNSDSGSSTSNGSSNSSSNSTTSTNSSSHNIAGDYKADGTNPNGQKYSADLKVTPHDDVYQFTWVSGKSSYDGVGVMTDNEVAVSFAGDGGSGKGCGVVLYKIASEVGVPFEMRYESPEVIDVDFSNYSLDQALRSISPEIRFYYRLDLQTFQIQPLRLALVAPSAPKS